MARAQAIPADGRPASVPSAFIATPFGYFHPSCVHQVEPGETVLDVGVQKADGTFRSISPCQYPRFDAVGNVIGSSSNPPPPETGWLEYAYKVLSPMQYLFAQWTVPANPAVVDNQIIYLFPGFQDSPLTRAFQQTVLAWNGAYGGGKKWVIYSWTCCPSGENNFYSAPLDVTAGMNVRGWVQGQNCNAGTGMCNTWRISTGKQTGPQTWLGTTLDTLTGGNQMVELVGGALEVYALGTCRDLPSGANPITFSGITGQYVGGGTVGGSFSTLENPFTPDCTTGVGTTSSSATLNYTTDDPYWCPGGKICCEPGTSTCDICAFSCQ